MWLAATPPANMWTATITDEAWKMMGSWSLSETPLHRSPHTRDAPAEPRRCVFRTDNEWRAIFRRLGLRVESTAAPPRDCIPHYQVDRALYKLNS